VFFTGLALFLLGAAGEFAGHSYFSGVAGWIDVLPFDAEVIGVLLAVVGTFVVGIVMLLTE
jgi:hypothetical protein